MPIYPLMSEMYHVSGPGKMVRLLQHTLITLVIPVHTSLSPRTWRFFSSSSLPLCSPQVNLFETALRFHLCAFPHSKSVTSHVQWPSSPWNPSSNGTEESEEHMVLSGSIYSLLSPFTEGLLQARPWSQGWTNQSSVLKELTVL